MHKLTTFDDDVLYLSDSQAEAVLSAMRGGMKYLTIDGQVIAVSAVASLIEEDRLKNTTNTGKLYDGSLVRRVFGEWRDFYDTDVKIDPSYYPEVSGDYVPSVEDFEKLIAPLSLEERKPAMRKLGLPEGETGRSKAIAGSKKLQSFKEIAKISPVDYYEGQ